MTDHEHLSIDTLADLAAGLLDARETEAVRARLAGCDVCGQRVDDLARVSEALASVPAPPMPPDVAARLDAALTAEARARTSGAGRVGEATPARDAGDRSAADAGPAATDADREGVVVPLARQARRKGRARLAAALAAAAVVVLAGGVAGVRAFQGGDAGKATSAPSRVGAGEGRAPAEKDEQPTGPRVLAEATGPVTASGRDYSSRTLPRQVADLLREKDESHGMSAQQARPTPAPLRPLADPVTLARCTTRVAGDAGRHPLVVDLARYASSPAAVIVVAGPRKGEASVWVVDPSCSQVRLHTVVAR